MGSIDGRDARFDRRNIALEATSRADGISDDNCDDETPASNPTATRRRRTLQLATQTFLSLSPLWTLVAALYGSKLGSLGTLPPSTMTSASLPSLGLLLTSPSTARRCLSTLMLAMGVATTPRDMGRALRSPRLLALNAALCFGLMPLLSLLLASTTTMAMGIDHAAATSLKTGVVLLGCLSGGQASNLFALLAGGDAALSIACTLSTALLGAIATPFLVQLLLGSAVTVGGGVAGVFASVASLVLLPLLSGLSLSYMVPRWTNAVRPWCPTVGLVATLCLVVGGAAGAAGSSLSAAGGGSAVVGRAAILLATLLPLLGGLASLCLVRGKSIPEKEGRTLVVETLSKSPTLAFVLAKRHFCGAEAVPAAAMVSLAVVGAVVACVWGTMPVPIDEEAA